MRYPEYEVVELPKDSNGRLGDVKAFALSYKGNCEECAWRQSGYCPCITEQWKAETIKHKGEDIPWVVVSPEEDSPKQCWKL